MTGEYSSGLVILAANYLCDNIVHLYNEQVVSNTLMELVRNDYLRPSPKRSACLYYKLQSSRSLGTFKAMPSETVCMIIIIFISHDYTTTCSDCGSSRTYVRSDFVVLLSVGKAALCRLIRSGKPYSIHSLSQRHSSK